MILGHTKLAVIEDSADLSDLKDLVEELRDLRRGDIAQNRGGRLIQFLVAFYLPGNQKKFVPIHKRNLSLEYWLQRKFSECLGTNIYRLCLELVPGGDTQPDTADGRKIYSVLNSLMKPHCRRHLNFLRRRR